MAIRNEPYANALAALYGRMETEPMSPGDYANELAEITNTQILTAEVKMGIPVTTAGSATAQEGATTANGEVI